MKEDQNKAQPAKKKAEPFVLKTKDKTIDLKQYDPDTPTILREDINCDRLFIINSDGHTIHIAPGVHVTAEYTLLKDCKTLVIKGTQEPGRPWTRTRWKGGFRIAGSVEYMIFDTLDICHAEHGILASQHLNEEIYKYIEITNCHFYDIEKEGIYIGKSDAESDAPLNSMLIIKGCFLTRCGWDGIQAGRFYHVKISDTEVTGVGTLGVKWQDKAITINPHCGRVDIANCTFSGPQQYLQSGKLFVN